MSRPSLTSGIGMGAPIIAWTLTWLGCGGPAYHPVGGKVTLDGRPLPDATVSFIPQSDEGTPAFGKTDSEGNYSLEESQDVVGLVAGKYSVRITTFFEGVPEYDPPLPALPEKVPAKYNVNTELIEEVKPGENVINLELESAGEIIQPDTYQ